MEKTVVPRPNTYSLASPSAISASGPRTVPGIGARGRMRQSVGSGWLSASAMGWAAFVCREEQLENAFPGDRPRIIVWILAGEIGSLFESGARQPHLLEAVGFRGCQHQLVES